MLMFIFLISVSTIIFIVVFAGSLCTDEVEFNIGEYQKNKLKQLISDEKYYEAVIVI